MMSTTRITHGLDDCSSRDFYAKPTMFQVMCKVDPIEDVCAWYEGVKGAFPKIVGKLRGLLQSSVDFDKVKDRDILNAQIGSVTMSHVHEGKTFSILLFRNGKLKISGGFPVALIELNEKDGYESYITSVVKKIKVLCRERDDVNDMNVTCVNGQFHHKVFSDLKRLEHAIGKMRSVFHHIKYPENDHPGRRGAFKLYLYKDKKTHVAMDIRGKAQIFGCKSIGELFHIFEMFEKEKEIFYVA